MRDPILESLESPLKRLRKERKVRQSDLAVIANVSQGHLSEVENGIAMPCKKLSRVLEAIDLLRPQKDFIRMSQIEIKRKWQLAVRGRRCN